MRSLKQQILLGLISSAMTVAFTVPVQAQLRSDRDGMNRPGPGGGDRGRPGGADGGRGAPAPRPNPRPEPPAPAPRPNPVPAPHPGRPNNPGHGGSSRDQREGRGGDSRRNEIDHRRESVRQERNARNSQIERDRYSVGRERQDWRGRYQPTPRRDRDFRSDSRWESRYARWYAPWSRPAPPRIEGTIRWYKPMPRAGSWEMAQIESVAVNIESLSREVYTTMAQAVAGNSNREYSVRLTNVLSSFVDAAELYTDAVYNGYDYVDSLNELFYLESQLDLLETTLDGYSRAYLVQDEMKALRYYVSELLWNYRARY